MADFHQQMCICIPARYESTRLPGKLLKTIDGKSLIRLTYEQCLRTTHFSMDNIFVLTDNQAICEEIQQLGGKCILNTIVDCCNGTERIAHLAPELPPHFQYIFNVQGDEPFIDPRHIDHMVYRVKAFIDADEHFSCAILHHVSHDPWYVQNSSTVKVVTDAYDNALYYSRAVIPSNKTHTFVPEVDYKVMIGVYFFLRKDLPMLISGVGNKLWETEDVEQNRTLELGLRIKSVETPYGYEGSVNTEEDFCRFSEK